MDLLRAADPQRRIEWAAAPLKPAALATTRLAEHWTHGLDVTGPLGIDFPDTARLRHVAWLAHRMLPYAFGLAGQPAAEIRAELTAPDGTTTWEFGPPDAASAITGDAGLFCRVAAQRLAPAQAAQSRRSHRSRPADQRPGRSPGAGPPPHLRGLSREPALPAAATTATPSSHAAPDSRIR